MKVAIWASPHIMTPEQKQDLEKTFDKVWKLQELHPSLLERLTNLQPGDDLQRLAESLIGTAANQSEEPDRTATIIQPAGSPAFQFILGGVKTTLATERNLIIPIWYAQSVRSTQETQLPDGRVKKISVFLHQGWTKV